MRFQLDTINRRIQVLDECPLGTLVEQLDSILSGWRGFTLTKNIGVDFDAPIPIDRWYTVGIHIPEIVPYKPDFRAGKEPINFSSAEYQGIYNIEIME